MRSYSGSIRSNDGGRPTDSVKTNAFILNDDSAMADGATPVVTPGIAMPGISPGIAMPSATPDLAILKANFALPLNGVLTSWDEGAVIRDAPSIANLLEHDAPATYYIEVKKWLKD